MPFTRSDAVQWLLLTAVFAGLLYLLGPILSPFVAAAILSYICNPLVSRLVAWKLSRTSAVLVVMLGLILLGVALLLIMLPLLQKEISLLMVRVPEWIELARTHVQPLLQQWFGISVDWDTQAFKNLLMSHWQNAGGVAAKVLPWLGDSSGMLLGVLTNLLLIPVVMFYLMRDWDYFVSQLDSLVPRHWHAKVREIMKEVDRVLAEFLRGQIAVMLLMSLFYVVALWLANLEFALPIGIVAGLLVFVPYLGMVLGLVLASLAAVMQFTHLSDIVVIWAVFGAGQLLEGMVVTPWLVGERIGLHPLAVIFALLAFGQLFGFFGLLLALPLAAILLVVLRHSRERYLTSSMYQKP